ncbi:MAG: chemotaxis protein CheX [Gemmatimonadaceae bacterium]|nr:chemotaxis protein CheX [Gemmatimonadaceae bacterium]
MSNIMEQSLSRTTAATFEELALLFPEADPTPEQAAAPLDVTVSVDFRGPLTGRLVLRASESILPAIASNMLGEEESQHVPLQRDALGELANVICGNVLPIVAGAEAVFHLAAPHIHRDDSQRSRETDAARATTTFGVEDGRVQAELYVFDDASALAGAGVA